MVERVISPALDGTAEESISTIETVHSRAQELANTIDYLENRPSDDSEAVNHQQIFELKQQIKDKLSVLDSPELPKLAAKTSVYNESLTLTELILDVACARIEGMEVSGAMRAFLRQKFDDQAGEFYEKLQEDMQRQSLVRGDLEVSKPHHDKPRIRHRQSRAEPITNLNENDDAKADLADESPSFTLPENIRRIVIEKRSTRKRILNLLKNASTAPISLYVSIQTSKALERLATADKRPKRVVGFIGAAALAGTAGLVLGLEVGSTHTCT